MDRRLLYLCSKSKITPIHPNLTDYTSNGWSLTYSATYPSRIASGNLWTLFKASPAVYCEIFVDNSSWEVTLTPPASGEYFFTGFSAMNFENPSFYRNGSGCTIKTYKNNVLTSTNSYVYSSGFSISAVKFDKIVLSGFYGGYQADDLCHGMGIMYLNGYVLK